MATLDDTAAPVTEKSVESSASAVEAGAAAAAATSTPAAPPTPEAAEQARKIAAAFAFTTSLSHSSPVPPALSVVFTAMKHKCRRGSAARTRRVKPPLLLSSKSDD